MKGKILSEEEEEKRKLSTRSEVVDKGRKERQKVEKSHGQENQVSTLFFFFPLSLHPSHPILPLDLALPPPSPTSATPLLSNLIFIAAESLKQFTWSAGDTKIDQPPSNVSARQTEKGGRRRR